MSSHVDRRSFLKTASLGAGALSAGVFGVPNILHAANRREKLNVALIGCGGRGHAHLDAVRNENLVAIVDVDEKQFPVFLDKRAEDDDNADKIQTFTDYRVMFDEHPTSIELESAVGGSDERYPTGTRLRWDFPARGDLAPVKTYWYDGFTAASAGSKKGGHGPHYFPPLLEELRKKYPDQKFDGDGTLYVGDKGIFYTGTYGGGMTLIPHKLMKETPEPAKSLPRPKGSFADFIRAVKEGKTDTATSFDYATRLTEFMLLGNLAQHAGVGNKVEWDGPNMQVTNLPDLNRWLKREYRKGWEV